MKTLSKLAAMVLICLSPVAEAATNNLIKKDSLGLPGDNLNLNAVLNVFKESSSVANFETKLNDADTKVNNLDLNNDGKVDYLRIHEKSRKNTHTLIIQAILGEKEIQDVAVITVTKKGDQLAHVQIVGDPALYGKDYIIEPKPEDMPADSSAVVSGKQSPTDNDDVYAQGNDNSNYNNNVNVNVGVGAYGYYNAWYWPSISLMFGPGYAYWNSPYYWGYYPGWWSPWRPMFWGGYYAYWGYNRGFYGSYCRVGFYSGRGYRYYNRNYRTGSHMVRNNMRHGYAGGPRGGYGHNRSSATSHWGGYAHGASVSHNRPAASTSHWGGYARGATATTRNNHSVSRSNWGGYNNASRSNGRSSFNSGNRGGTASSNMQRGSINRGGNTGSHFGSVQSRGSIGTSRGGSGFSGGRSSGGGMRSGGFSGGHSGGFGGGHSGGGGGFHGGGGGHGGGGHR